MVSREQIDTLGYFDERPLGIGEEDGDVSWRYISEFGRPISNYSIKAFENYTEKTLHVKPENIKCHSDTKYSLFNKKFIYDYKYKKDPMRIREMFDYCSSINDRASIQYPRERFFRTLKDEL